MKNKEIEELLNSIDEIIKEAPDEAIYGIQIKEYKQIKNHIEQLEEDNEDLKRICETQNGREYRSKFLKEFQKEHGKNVFPDYDEIYKRYDKLKEENKQLEKKYNRSLDKLRNLRVENEQLKTNRDKAIEYLHQGKFRFWEMENILKGDSDDK